ncbi:MAG TPA: L,D-transpeptidase [Candidatus Obscuribacterales bacterium]
METLIRSVWLRRAGTFWACVALILVAFFSWSTPSMAASKSARFRHGSVHSKTVVKNRSQRRWIEVNLARQRLYVWKGRKRLYSVAISSGKRSTPTRTGIYRIQSKHISTRMRGRDYNVPNVPYAMYYSGGYAIHGAYWHNRFGTRVSHGCVNLPVGAARRVYRLASVGTRVVVHN